MQISRHTLIPLLLLGAAVAAPGAARADVAVKFFGTARAGDLTPETSRALAESGVDVTGMGCFELPILDLETGLVAGVGVDCLNVFDAAGDAAGDGLQLEAKTFFFLPQGLIVNHGCTSVRPFFGGVGDSGVTHMTGSIGPAEMAGAGGPGAVGGDGPEICSATGGIIHTTQGFSRFGGETRLSGAVDLSQAGDGVITFSCVFVIHLEPAARADRQGLLRR